MIEKIMKAVKSSNKRRGRNITIGAVIGFLLSCTAVMGADEIGVDITVKENEIVINDEDKFSDNTFENETYTNNMTISAENASGNAYGIKLKLSGESSISIINNGTISGNSTQNTKSTGNGIYNESGTIETLTNNGLISGSSPTNGYGISNSNGIGILANNGIISGSSSANGYGIYNNNSGKLITSLTNNGIISGSGSNGNGIKTNNGTIKTLTNNGIISGSGSNGYGIYTGFGKIETLTNTGVIYGKTNAIVRGNGDIGTEKKGTANNYGILVNGNDGGKVVNNLTIVNATPDKDNINLSKNQILNRGLIFTALGAGYKVGEEDYKQFGAIYKDKDIVIGYEKDDENPDSSNPITKKYTIINAKAIESESDMTGINAATEEVKNVRK